MIFWGLHHLGHQEHREDSGLSHPAQQQILHMQKDGLLEGLLPVFLGDNLCKTLLS